MSTVKTNTLTGTTSAGSISVTGEGGSTTTNLQQGLTKVWYAGNHSGGSISATDSFNVGSYTDVAEGVHKPNFTNNFSTAEGYGHAGTHGANEDVINMNYSQQCHNRNDVDTGSCEIVSAFGHATTQGVYDYHYVTKNMCTSVLKV
jgi:hypothetical protein